MDQNHQQQLQQLQQQQEQDPTIMNVVTVPQHHHHHEQDKEGNEHGLVEANTMNHDPITTSTEAEEETTEMDINHNELIVVGNAASASGGGAEGVNGGGGRDADGVVEQQQQAEANHDLVLNSNNNMIDPTSSSLNEKEMIHVHHHTVVTQEQQQQQQQPPSMDPLHHDNTLPTTATATTTAAEDTTINTTTTTQTNLFVSPPPQQPQTQHHQQQQQQQQQHQPNQVNNYYSVPHPRPYSALINGTKPSMEQTTPAVTPVTLAAASTTTKATLPAARKRGFNEMEMIFKNSNNQDNYHNQQQAQEQQGNNNDNDPNGQSQNINEMNKKLKLNNDDDSSHPFITDPSSSNNQQQEEVQPLHVLQNHWQQQQQEQHHPSIQQQQQQQQQQQDAQPQHQNQQQSYVLQSPGPIQQQQQQQQQQHGMTVNVTGDTPHSTTTTLPQVETIQTVPSIPPPQQQHSLISNDGRALQTAATGAPQPPPPVLPGSKPRSATYSRKDKALGLLAQRLVAMFEARSHAAYEYHQQQQQQQQQDFTMTHQYQSQHQQQEIIQNGPQGNNNGGDTISTHPNDTTTITTNETTITSNTTNHTNQDKLCTPSSTTTMTTTPLLSIDQTASELLVERRRIYDIINILEALNVVTKKGKNVYWWHGLKVLETTFKDLQAIVVFCEEFREDAERNGMIDSAPTSTTGSTNAPVTVNASGLVDDGSDRNGLNELDTTTTDSYFALSVKKNPLNGDVASPNHGMIHQQQQQQQQQQPPMQTKTTKQANSPKLSSGSLGQLTKKFLSLYLIGYDALSLGEATERLLGLNPDAEINPPPRGQTHRRREIQTKGWKTKVRRLYDIANVLCSVGIIDKTSSPLSHKKCGNMLTSDGRAVTHHHKNNQYFYWKFHKTPKQLFLEHQSLRLAENVQTQMNQNGNGANPLCMNENEQPIELAQPTHPGKEIPMPLEDKSVEVASSIYEL